MADVFEDHPDPETATRLAIERTKLFGIIERTKSLIYQLLTKRPENMMAMAPPGWQTIWPMNVWAMTSAENQATFNDRLPHLKKVPAIVRGLSLEPLLDTIRITPSQAKGIDWVIIGGESGHGARPCKIRDIESLVNDCTTYGIPVFVKQLGSRPICYDHDLWLRFPSKDKKGGDMDEFPFALRRREFPK